MSTQTTKMANKLGLQKSKSMLNTLAHKQKKVNPQTTINSGYFDVKKKRQQLAQTNSQLQINRYQVQGNISSRSKVELKNNTITLTKDPTVSIQEQGIPSSRKIKNLQDKAKLISNKMKNSQPSKQSLNQRETIKPNKFKIEEKIKQFCNQHLFNCSIRSNVYSYQSHLDNQIGQNSQAAQLNNQELVKKLNEMMQENKLLKVKLEKLKISNLQNRKSLKDQVASFNLQGQQAKKTKQTLGQLQCHNTKLIEQITKLKKQNAANILKIEEITSEKRRLEQQNELQHQNLWQLKRIYITIKQKYQAQTKTLQEKNQEINQLIANNSEITSLQLQSKLNKSSAYLDQVTDLSINSQIKDDQVHSKPIVQDPKTLQICNRIEEKYLGLINDLKNRLLESQLQNFELQAEIQRLKHSKQNQQSVRIDLSTQAEKLLLLMQNNRLKINEYETKQQIKQLKEKLKLSQLQNKQIKVEKEVKQQQLAAIQAQLIKIQHQDQFMKQENFSFKLKLQQSQQLVKNLRQQRQQDLLSKKSVIKKVKFFK